MIFKNIENINNIKEISIKNILESMHNRIDLNSPNNNLKNVMFLSML